MLFCRFPQRNAHEPASVFGTFAETKADGHFRPPAFSHALMFVSFSFDDPLLNPFGAFAAKKGLLPFLRRDKTAAFTRRLNGIRAVRILPKFPTLGIVIARINPDSDRISLGIPCVPEVNPQIRQFLRRKDIPAAAEITDVPNAFTVRQRQRNVTGLSGEVTAAVSRLNRELPEP